MTTNDKDIAPHAGTRTAHVHRAIRQLNSLMKHYPGLSHQLDTFLLRRGKDLPDWPKSCFLPMAGWRAIARQRWGSNLFGVIADHQALSAIGTWRYSQGIYRIDPDLLAALTDSTVSGALPADLLFHMPEHSLYVETPGLYWDGYVLHGFWVHIEFDTNHLRPELGLLLDFDETQLGFSIHIGQWTLAEAVDRALAQAAERWPSLFKDDDIARDLTELFAPLVSIVLYLCSERPEIDNARYPGLGPIRPGARKTKSGWRMFPADRPAYFDVGLRIGKKLRQAREDFAREPVETGRTVRPHLRRGHWHGFWYGARNGERRINLKWLPPLLVANVEPEPPEKIAA
jgi:hypothetical protein